MGLSTQPSAAASWTPQRGAADRPAPLPVDGPASARDAFSDANAWLNDRVDRKVASLKAAGAHLSPEIAWAADHDHSIYQRRFKPMVWAVLIGSAVGMLQAPNLWVLLVAWVALYFVVDFYSGVLHVVLDNPRFVDLPLMGIPCVEFQWHHSFPHDISSRRMLDVWGDLNVLLTVKLLCLLVLAGLSPLTFMVAGVGFFWGYANQVSHRLCHTAPSRRPALGRALQRAGVLLDPATHKVHHDDHTQAFPVLSGASRSLVQWLLRVVPNQWVWLTVFVLLTAGDLALVVWLMRWAGLAT